MTSQNVVNHVPVWTLGDRLRKVRREADMTLDDFAAAVGVGRASLAHYETDRKRPRDIVGVARAIESRFGVPAVWVLGLEEAPPPFHLAA